MIISFLTPYYLDVLINVIKTPCYLILIKLAVIVSALAVVNTLKILHATTLVLLVRFPIRTSALMKQLNLEELTSQIPAALDVLKPV